MIENKKLVNKFDNSDFIKYTDLDNWAKKSTLRVEQDRIVKLQTYASGLFTGWSLSMMYHQSS